MTSLFSHKGKTGRSYRLSLTFLSSSLAQSAAKSSTLRPSSRFGFPITGVSLRDCGAAVYQRNHAQSVQEPPPFRHGLSPDHARDTDVRDFGGGVHFDADCCTYGTERTQTHCEADDAHWVEPRIGKAGGSPGWNFPEDFWGCRPIPVCRSMRSKELFLFYDVLRLRAQPTGSGSCRMILARRSPQAD